MLMPRAPHLLIWMMVSHFAPSKAIAWIWHMSGKSFSLPAALMQVITSLAVPVPCSFWPLSSSASITSHVLGDPSFWHLAKMSAHLRLRPPKHVVTWLGQG